VHCQRIVWATSAYNLQFGFKAGLSCSHALFTLRTVCDYYNKRGSSVYIASLDASKAFDKVNHSRLFSHLLSKNVPLCFIRVMFDWYSNYSVLSVGTVLNLYLFVSNLALGKGVFSPLFYLTFILMIYFVHLKTQILVVMLMICT